MSKNNAKYWTERFESLESRENRKGLAYYNELKKSYDIANMKIDKDLELWYSRLAKNNNISMHEAKKLLSEKELKEFKWNVKEYIEKAKENSINGKWITELENASARYHISRLDAIKLQMRNHLELMAGNNNEFVENGLGDIYTDTYYHTAYEIQKGRGVGAKLGVINEEKVKKILAKPWLGDGKTFSTRLWEEKETLVNEVNKLLTQNIIMGLVPDKSIKLLAERMNVSKSRAGRIIMTEQAAFSSMARKDCFNDLDVDRYQIIATLDSRTSRVCRHMDKEVFDMKDFEVGVNAPPFHPFCRTTTIPYFDDWEELGIEPTQVARDEDGKTYHVPASMGYGEWREKFVEKEKEIEADLSRKTNNSAKEIKEHTIDVPNLKEDEKNSIIECKEANQEIEKELKKRSTEFWDSMLDSEKEAIQKYSGPYYRDINKYLRGVPDITKDTEKIIKIIEEIDRALSRNSLGDDLILYRGVSLEEFESWKNINTINTYKSTSISREVADDFNSDYKILIKAHKDTKGFYLGDYSEYKSEKEFLLHRNQKYKILNMTDNELEVEFYDR